MPSAQGHITVRRRPKDGNDGSDAVRYWVVPSVTSISKSKSGTFTPSFVTLSVMRQIGSAAASTITTLFVRYKLTYTNSLTMNWQQLTNGSSIAVSGYARSVEIELYMTGSVTAGVAYGSGACLDRVSIPVVIDGNDGVQGLQGCIYRRSRFATGFQYRNDSALTTTTVQFSHRKPNGSDVRRPIHPTAQMLRSLPVTAPKRGWSIGNLLTPLNRHTHHSLWLMMPLLP